MHKFLRLLMLLLVLSMIDTACSKTSLDRLLEEQNRGSTQCDTVDMKYSTDIVPILEVHCYSCHGNGNTGGSGGINLDGYANIKTYIDHGFVLGNVRHDPGFVAMPYMLPKLDTCTINKITDWINRGAPDN
jgi:hypothetical protein